MILFGQCLPRIRDRVEADLHKADLPREKVLATVVKLLETTFIRVGNSEYARHNNSFGLTTLEDRHVDVSAATLNFHFRGKSGIYHKIKLADKRLARIVKQCRDIPGSELFQYIDDDGKSHTIDSSDVNAYIKDISGEEFTAKDFRTWAGTMLAAMALHEFEQFDKQTQAKKNVMQAIERVAERLGNTPTICKKCYIHPAIVESYLDGSLRDILKERVGSAMEKSLSTLHPEEAAVMALLNRRLHQQESPACR